MNESRHQADDLVPDLLQKLETWECGNNSAQQFRYMLQMWRFVLSMTEKDDTGSCEDCDAIPYIPFDPGCFGLEMDQDSALLDAGCLGGYGLFDISIRRTKAGLSVPRMTGIDTDAESVRLGREMAALWARDTRVTFSESSCEEMPFTSETFDIVLARLLLPYVRVDQTLAEISRVLRPQGIVLFQIHAFRYYARQLLRSFRSARSPLYYLRALISGAAFGLSGRQPKHRWFSESALSAKLLVRLCRRHGLSLVWQGGQASKPLFAFKKG